VKGVGESGLAEVVEQPAEALDLGGFGFRDGCNSEFRGIDGFREFVKDGQDDVESADVTGISDKVEGGRLRRGHGKHAGVAFAGLERSGCEIPFPEKADGETRQSERPFLPGDYDLELLDLLVGGPMQGGGAQETDVVGQVQRAHQVVQIPIGGRDSLHGELYGHDGVKTFTEPFYATFF